MSQWEQLSIYINESDPWQGKPLYLALLEAARKQRLSGATVFRGIAGFGVGHQRRIHTARIMELADLPVVVTAIDRSEAIDAFLATIKEMVTVGLVVREVVNVVHEGTVDLT